MAVYSRLLAGLFVIVSVAACSKTNTIYVQEEGGYTNEPVPEKLVFTEAQLTYSGDDGYTGSSDLWELTLYTDMEIDDFGYPVGPGQMLQLSFNARINDAQRADISYIAGSYTEQSSTGDFSAGTFLWGEMTSIDLPTGRIDFPRWSFFGDIPAGETDFDADLLNEGRFSIAVGSDGTLSVEGIVVGTKYLKRYFSYTGKVEPRDNAEREIPNSSLTGDITLSNLTKARLTDYGNYFFLDNDESREQNATSYKMFRLYLASATVNLDYEYPAGSGSVLQLDMFVPYETDVRNGLPAGEYTICPRTQWGVERSDIIPFRFVEGAVNQFSNPTGSWYRTIVAGSISDTWARITGGTVKVERSGSTHNLTIDLLDCNTPAYHVRCNWSGSSVGVYNM